MIESSIIRSSIATGLVIGLCGEQGIFFNGQHFFPNHTRAYFQFQFAHAFPQGSTVYQTGLHPAVVAKSYKTLLNQNINYEHQIGSYHAGEDVRDRVIGAVVAVDYPREPAGGWKLDLNAAPPAITGIGVLFKQTQGMAKIMGEHISSKRKYTVSMEVLYPLMPGDDVENPKSFAGFAVATNGNKPMFDTSPPDFLEAGYEYVPADQAPDDLVATFSRKKSRVVAQYKGRKVHVLMGGLNNQVHFAGAGVVAFGAEPTAKILRLAASADRLLLDLADTLMATFQN